MIVACAPRRGRRRERQRERGDDAARRGSCPDPRPPLTTPRLPARSRAPPLGARRAGGRRRRARRPARAGRARGSVTVNVEPRAVSAATCGRPGARGSCGSPAWSRPPRPAAACAAPLVVARRIRSCGGWVASWPTRRGRGERGLERVDVAGRDRQRRARGVLQQQRAQVDRGDPRVHRDHQRRDAADHRRGHRGAGLLAVAAVVGRREDQRRRARPAATVRRAEVRVGVQAAAVVGRRGGDADQVRRRDRRRIGRAGCRCRARRCRPRRRPARSAAPAAAIASFRRESGRRPACWR